MRREFESCEPSGEQSKKKKSSRNSIYDLVPELLCRHVNQSMKRFGRLVHIFIFIITKDIVKMLNEISFQWIVGSRIHDEIIYNLRVDDFVGVLAKDKFGELSGENKTVLT